MSEHKLNPRQQRHYKALYEALGPASDQISDYLDGLSDDQLIQAEQMVNGLGTTNCAAMMFYGKTLFLEAIRDERLRRLQPAVGYGTRGTGASDE